MPEETLPEEALPEEYTAGDLVLVHKPGTGEMAMNNVYFGRFVEFREQLAWVDIFEARPHGETLLLYRDEYSASMGVHPVWLKGKFAGVYGPETRPSSSPPAWRERVYTITGDYPEQQTESAKSSGNPPPTPRKRGRPLKLPDEAPPEKKQHT